MTDEAAYTPMKGAENKGAVVGTSDNARISISETTETSKSDTVSTKNMTMDEYKQYIRDKIDSIPRGPVARMTTTSITISEEGFEAMRHFQICRNFADFVMNVKKRIFLTII